jgi:hypothetical protein
VTDDHPDLIVQEAPWPTELDEIIKNFQYKPGWFFNLSYRDRGQGSKGLTLTVTTLTTNSYDHDPTNVVPDYRVNHFFIVPAASYNRTAWTRWLLDRFIEIEAHEACEFFRVDGERIFAPHHSEGEDPYSIFMIGDKETAQKKYTEK